MESINASGVGGGSIYRKKESTWGRKKKVTMGLGSKQSTLIRKNFPSQICRIPSAYNTQSRFHFMAMALRHNQRAPD